MKNRLPAAHMQIPADTQLDTPPRPDLDLVQIARGVLQSESESILALSPLIGEDFIQVVRAIAQSKGRLVISGIGKSAIIAQKMVGTLNSTGTPSLFMHAADAIHGDLGLVRAEDIVLVVSKSGESPEIRSLVPFVQTQAAMVIAMVGNAHSFLAKAARFVLRTDVKTESCPHNLTPTNSTTAQLALGDALAVCLMRWNNFSARDFAHTHPGGLLGKTLRLSVKQMAEKNSRPYVFTQQTFAEVLPAITQGRLGAVVVLDAHEHIVGIITDGDIRRALEKDMSPRHTLAHEMMTHNPVTIPEDTLAVDALSHLRARSINQLILTNQNNQYTGLVHLHDFTAEGLH